ncbi:MAG TPA: hypothetical protein PLS50_03090, partial [Candidatus Dojkabacteria bacterium]|nr:hypothetical protein [Candidatus Dojkabacteria bacterium]
PTPTDLPEPTPTEVVPTSTPVEPTVEPTARVLSAAAPVVEQRVLADTGINMYSTLGLGSVLLSSVFVLNKDLGFMKRK